MSCRCTKLLKRSFFFNDEKIENLKIKLVHQKVVF